VAAAVVVKNSAVTANLSETDKPGAVALESESKVKEAEADPGGV
jgi:hypothetical protein